VAWVAEQVRQEALAQWASPEAVQAELQEVERMRDAGEITQAEADARQEALVDRLLSTSVDQGLVLEPWEGEQG